MGTYSIKDLETLSGIKAHTLRIWEKRHGIITPERTTTNIRFYSDHDLKKILCVALLNSHGLKISKIVGMSVDELNEKVMEIAHYAVGNEGHLNQLVIGMLDLDEQKFNKIINDYSLERGFESTILDLIYPFLEKIGVLWQTNNIQPAHEHFISCLIRQKIISAINAIDTPKTAEVDFLLYLPENEMHELGLLFYNYLVRNAGYSSLYLGQSVPYNDLRAVFRTRPFKKIVTSFVSPTSREDLSTYLENLKKDFPSCDILVSGYQIQHYGFTNDANLTTFKTAKDLRALI